MAALRASASEIGRPGLQNRVAGSLVQLFVPVAGLAPATHVSATHGSWTDQKAGRPGQARTSPAEGCRAMCGTRCTQPPSLCRTALRFRGNDDLIWSDRALARGQ